MRVRVGVYHGTSSHQQQGAELVASGVRRNGDVVIDFKGSEAIPDADVLVFWGHRNTRLINHQKELGRDYLVMERAYLGDRFNWMSLGFNGLNGRADFVNEAAPSDRGDEWRGMLKPWTDDGHKIVVCGQVYTDAAILGLVNMPTWIAHMKNQCEAIYGLPVEIRAHPKYAAAQPPLEQQLIGAKACITFSSNSGVLAVMQGIPTVTMDIGAMAYEVTSHDPGTLVRPDRTGWLDRLAYCQWKPQEIQQGDAWAHLRRRYAHQRLSAGAAVS